MFHELVSRDRGDGCPTGQPQGVGSEAYLNSTSQGPTPEDARKDAHIRGRSRQLVKYPGYEKSPRWPIKQPEGARIDKEVSTLLYVKI
jgi:hypothetical protein